MKLEVIKIKGHPVYVHINETDTPQQIEERKKEIYKRFMSPIQGEFIKVDDVKMIEGK